MHGTLATCALAVAPAQRRQSRPMARNIEIKARVEHMATLMARTAAIADQGPVDLLQDDTFFVCPTGRLKLRSFVTGEGELIFYRRADLPGPKESFYLRSPISTPGALRECLSLAYGQAGRVQKHRTVYFAGRTRIHLDRVLGLGEFMELEVVLDEHESSEAGLHQAHALMARLGVAPSQLVAGAYVDLLAQQGPTGSRP